MNTDPGAYQQQLLLAMRLHNIPGPRIAEALAEVQSHLTETGEDPHDAFGDPKSYARFYADQLSNTQGGNGPHSWRGGLLGSVTWYECVYALVLCVGTSLFIGGFIGMATGGEDFLGLPKITSALVGLAVLVAIAVSLVGHPRRSVDHVVSPHADKDITAPVPVWIIGGMMAVPCGTLLLACLLVVAGR